MTEATLQKNIQHALREHGAWVVKTHGNQFTQRGVPDLLVCYKGRFVAMEVKVGKNQATLAQRVVIGKIVEAGGLAGVVRSVDEALALLRLADKFIGERREG